MARSGGALPATRAHRVAQVIIAKALQEPCLGCPGTKARRKDLKIRSAEQRNASIIAGWFTGDDFRLLGGAKSKDRTATIREWIAGSLAAFLLYRGDEPVAFLVIELNVDGPANANLTPEPDSQDRLELGRLIVHPDYRGQGFATSLLVHVYDAYLESIKDRAEDECHLLLRTYSNNHKCIGLLNRLPTRRIDAQDDGFVWFTLPGLPSRRDAWIGKLIARGRERLKISQQRLAYLGGMDSSTLGMIETGQRKLRVDDAGRLLSVLYKDPVDELELAAGLLGVGFDRAAWRVHESLSNELVEHQSLWIFADVLAEEDDGPLKLSIEMIGRKFDRYYFVPVEYPQSTIQRICRRFSSELDVATLNERVRFYRAPDSICHLRLAVHDPQPRIQDARKISVGTGRDAARLEVSTQGDPLTKHFMTRVYRHIRDADDDPTSTKLEFRRVPINWNNL